jgi:hypothetical protein
MPKEQPSEFVIELTGWKFDYSFWVEPKKRHAHAGPYFDFLHVELSGAIIVPKAERFAIAKLTMGHHDLYGLELETKDPHPIIGHVDFKRPVLEGHFAVPHRMITLIVQAMDQDAARYLYVHSEPLKRNRAYVRSVSFNSNVDLEAYSDPTAR